jgi:hypothetical protein
MKSLRMKMRVPCASYRRLWPTGSPPSLVANAKLDDSRGAVLDEPSVRRGSVDCVGEGQAVRCTISEDEPLGTAELGPSSSSSSAADTAWLSLIPATALLISPFFFWGTSMVAMKVLFWNNGVCRTVLLILIMTSACILTCDASLPVRCATYIFVGQKNEYMRSTELIVAEPS